MHPPVNRYLVIAWISVALALLSSGAFITMSLASDYLKTGDLSVPWTGIYLSAIAVWALMPMVFRRPVLGVGCRPPAYAPRHNLALLAIGGSLITLLASWSFLKFPALSGDPASAVGESKSLLFLFAMWMWMLAATAFPAWHNDPAWGAGNDMVPSLPRLAGKLVRTLSMGWGVASRPRH